VGFLFLVVLFAGALVLSDVIPTPSAPVAREANDHWRLFGTWPSEAINNAM